MANELDFLHTHIKWLTSALFMPFQTMCAVQSGSGAGCGFAWSKKCVFLHSHTVCFLSGMEAELCDFACSQELGFENQTFNVFSHLILCTSYSQLWPWRPTSLHMSYLTHLIQIISSLGESSMNCCCIPIRILSILNRRLFEIRIMLPSRAIGSILPTSEVMIACAFVSNFFTKKLILTIIQIACEGSTSVSQIVVC